MPVPVQVQVPVLVQVQVVEVLQTTLLLVLVECVAGRVDAPKLKGEKIKGAMEGERRFRNRFACVLCSGV